MTERLHPIQQISRVIALGVILALPLSASAAATGAETRVTLFGQPCVLRGPFDVATLKTIHSISPEQIYPPGMATADEDSPNNSLSDPAKLLAQLKKSGAQLQNAKNLPSSLDRYRERLGRRLDALQAFFTAALSPNHAGMTEAAQRYFLAAHAHDAEAFAKKVSARGIAAVPLATLFSAFDAGIEPDPSEDFHRGIERVNIHYVCSFEGDEHDSDQPAGSP